VTRVVVADAGRRPADQWTVEMVERKGTGHPDTLSDGVAEAISRAYSRYTLDLLGQVAHHWVDKCMLIGGESRITLGRGELIRPMKLIVAGKITREIGDRVIPVEDIVIAAAREFFRQRLPRLDIESGLTIDFELNSAVGAGRPARWYRPAQVGDLTPLPAARANDAVICSAYAPLSKTEQAVLDIERHLNGPAFKAEHPEIGSDIKVLASRVGRTVGIVACVPWIADLTPTRAFYDEGKRWVADEILRLARTSLTEHDITVRINTRDDDEAVYLTATGTASDTGDVGVVGRGNRINGLITPGRVTSIEAPAGKNPTYHSGKIYGVLALELARRVAAKIGAECYLSITTSTGNPLSAPDVVAAELVQTPPAEDVRAVVGDVVGRGLDEVGRVSDQLVRGEAPLW
jgi:S-adenosylmethionine synthetase